MLVAANSSSLHSDVRQGGKELQVSGTWLPRVPREGMSLSHPAVGCTHAGKGSPTTEVRATG